MGSTCTERVLAKGKIASILNMSESTNVAF